jgi:aspartate racemase
MIAIADQGEKMKKIGIVGGVGWRSTVDYYSEICRRSEDLHFAANDQGAPFIPEISIESLNLHTAISYLGNENDKESWSKFDAYHRKALERLEASGAEVALIASNTPHHRFSEIVRGIRIPVVDIYEAAAIESARVGARHILILGTALTMASDRFRHEFARLRVHAAAPTDESARTAVAALIAELQRGRFEGAAGRLEAIARDSIERQFQGDAAACLACTELPPAFPEFKTLPVFAYHGLSYINTTAVHVDAVIRVAAQDYRTS